MKKFLMVVMAMLLFLSVVAGCGGGDKKAELIKGLKTEIGTLLGNVDMRPRRRRKVSKA